MPGTGGAPAQPAAGQQRSLGLIVTLGVLVGLVLVVGGIGVWLFTDRSDSGEPPPVVSLPEVQPIPQGNGGGDNGGGQVQGDPQVEAIAAEYCTWMGEFISYLDEYERSLALPAGAEADAAFAGLERWADDLDAMAPWDRAASVSEVELGMTVEQRCPGRTAEFDRRVAEFDQRVGG